MSDQFQGESVKGSLKINLSTSVHEMCTRIKLCIYVVFQTILFFFKYTYFLLGGRFGGRKRRRGGVKIEKIAHHIPL